MTNQTKERIGKVIDDWFENEQGRLADALIQAGLIFRDEVRVDEGKLTKIIQENYLVSSCEFCNPNFYNIEEVSKAIATHIKELVEGER